MEEGQTPDSVEGDQHFDQKLFVLCFQRQSETIDYTGREKKERKRKSEHKLKQENVKELHCDHVNASGRSMTRTLFMQAWKRNADLTWGKERDMMILTK